MPTSTVRYVRVREAIVTVAGVRYEIPEIWLVGQARQREREGLNPLDAYRAAVADWIEQYDLSARFEREQESKP